MTEYNISEEIDTIKRRNIIALILCNLVNGLGIGMFQVVYQPFILDQTGSILITGIFVTIGAVLQFLPMPLIGKLSDRFGRKKILLMGIPIYILGLSFLIISSPVNLHFLILGIIFFYLGFSINNLNSLIFVSENTNKSKGLMYGLIYFSYFIGTIGGNFFVYAGTEFSSQFFFLVYIGLFFILELIYMFILSDKFQIKKNRILLENHSDGNLWRKIFQNPKAKVVLIFLSFDMFIYSISFSIYSAGLRDNYNITREQLALLLLGFNMSNMVSQIPAGHLTDKIGKMRSLVLSSLFGLGFFLLNILGFFFWSGGLVLFLFPILLLSHVIFGFNVSTFIPSEQILLTDLDEARKAESYGIVGFVRGVGYIPTGYIGGFLIENVNYILPFILTSIGILFEIWYLIKYLKD